MKQAKAYCKMTGKGMYYNNPEHVTYLAMDAKIALGLWYHGILFPFFVYDSKAKRDAYDNTNTRPNQFHVYNERYPRTMTANDYGYRRLPRDTRGQLKTLPAG